MTERASGARGRTIRRMQFLMSSAAALTACSSNQGTGAGPSATTASAGTASGKARSVDTSNVSSSTGYAVVDPVPAPSRCSVLGASGMTAKASFTKRDDGKHEISLHVDPPPKGVVYETKASIEVVNGDSPPALSQLPNDAVQLKAFVKDAASKSMGFVLRVTCNDEPGAVEILVDWSKEGTAAETPLTVHLTPQAWGFH